MVKELNIVNDIGQLSIVRDMMKSISSQCKWPERISMSLNLALEEAITNVILYAYPGKKNKKITIRFEVSGGILMIVITDTGIPFDPTKKEKPDLSLPLHERPIGGLGIHLVKEMMTDVRYTRSGDKNVLTMIKNMG